MIWIVGGTSEGDYFSKKLKEIPHIITLGTKEGLEYYSGKNYQYKRMTLEDMVDFIEKENINTVVDLSHPFAVNVSNNAKKASEKRKIPYFRYEREVTELGKNSIEFKSYEECFEYLKTWEGTLFLTTGSNRAEDFEKVRKENRFVYRILPMVESVEKLKNLNKNIKDIVAMVGPFTKELDKEIYKFYKVDGVVMKDSGKAGGTREKILACEELKIKSFVITRENKEMGEFSEFVEKFLENYKN